MNIDKELSELLVKIGVPSSIANILDTIIIAIALILLVICLNYISKGILFNSIKRIARRTAFKFDDLLVQKDVIKYVIHMIPPIIIYLMLPMFFEEGRQITSLIRKICVIYIFYNFLMALNGILLSLYENYTLKSKERHLPLRGIIQVIQVLLICIGIIVIVSVIINRSPATLLAGLGASAAIFSLVFKDLILSFIAGIQLSLSDMLRPGDWVTLNDDKTNGIVQEISLITVKIKNFDNSISTVPPNSLLTNTFKNWREMLESDGRLISRSIFVDKASVKFASPELMASLQNKYSFLSEYKTSDNLFTNTDLYRYYMEQYLINRPDVNKDMGLKIGELETIDRGLPILIYFFSRNKEDRDFERIRAEVFDHATAVLPDFGLIVK